MLLFLGRDCRQTIVCLPAKPMPPRCKGSCLIEMKSKRTRAAAIKRARSVTGSGRRLGVPSRARASKHARRGTNGTELPVISGKCVIVKIGWQGITDHRLTCPGYGCPARHTANAPSASAFASPSLDTPSSCCCMRRTTWSCKVPILRTREHGGHEHVERVQVEAVVEEGFAARDPVHRGSGRGRKAGQWDTAGVGLRLVLASAAHHEPLIRPHLFASAPRARCLRCRCSTTDRTNSAAALANSSMLWSHAGGTWPSDTGTRGVGYRREVSQSTTQRRNHRAYAAHSRRCHRGPSSRQPEAGKGRRSTMASGWPGETCRVPGEATPQRTIGSPRFEMRHSIGPSKQVEPGSFSNPRKKQPSNQAAPVVRSTSCRRTWISHLQLGSAMAQPNDCGGPMGELTTTGPVRCSSLTVLQIPTSVTLATAACLEEPHAPRI